MGFRKNKKKSAPEQTNLTLPPAPLPPMPGMPLPLPDATSMPPLPTLPIPAVAESVEIKETVTESSEKGEDYNELWAKKSNKPLPQIYGHIDRISAGEAGSLLDRYADRFGHALDRDIIVLRKQQHDDKIAQVRDAPVVELLEDETNELSQEEQLIQIEDEIRTLKPSYQEAKAEGDADLLAELKPQLELLLKERKQLQSSIAQSNAAPEESTSTSSAESAPVIAQVSNEEDLFVTFVAIVDELLGSNLPANVVESFVESDDFSVYQTVGSDPQSADDDLRSLFFSIVDGQLGNMDSESIETFVGSSDFEIYSTIGEMYQ
ncbi:MAG: hypothetical protein ISP82_01020 [Candidatus Poseidoniaceae archaeon]|nr:hypothetical protein [Candidatus Poseidoniaceae archaeon]MBL6895767.1 hypothetical protein [Candidatus Poseidoniaceae archaeon]